MLFMYENTILPLRDVHSSSGLWPRVSQSLGKYRPTATVHTKLFTYFIFDLSQDYIITRTSGASGALSQVPPFAQ